MANKVLIFTGMHRSGTSLIANLLQKAGVSIGKTFLEADRRNPHGFFEDMDFYEFHQQALYRSGELTPYVKPEFTFHPSQAELDKANLLIQKRADQPLWGWKDPRTCLFLDFWDQLLPEAYCIFVYRHPLDVLFSFVRRGEAHTPGLLEALTSWQVYNSTMLEFYRQHPDRCLLSHTYRVVDQIDEFGKLLECKFGLSLELSPALLESLYHPDELKRIPITAEVDDLLQKLDPASIELYQQLEALADLSSPSSGTASQQVVNLLALSDFVADLPAPYSPSLVRGLFFVLLSLLDDDLVDTYFKQHSHYIAQLEHGRGRLEAEVRGKQHWIEKQEAHIRQQAEYIKQQAQTFNNQKAWIEKQEAHVRQQTHTVNHQKAQIEQLEAELTRLQSSYVWRLGQRLTNSPLGRIARYFLRRRH